MDNGKRQRSSKSSRDVGLHVCWEERPSEHERVLWKRQRLSAAKRREGFALLHPLLSRWRRCCCLNGEGAAVSLKEALLLLWREQLIWKLLLLLAAAWLYQRLLQLLQLWLEKPFAAAPHRLREEDITRLSAATAKKKKP